MQVLARVFFVLLAVGVWTAAEGKGNRIATPRRVARQTEGEGEDVDVENWNTMVGSENWNAVVDDLLTQLASQIMQQGKDTMPIKKIEERFEKNLGLVKAVGTFETSEGTMTNISTIHRRSDVIVTSVPGRSVSLSSQLGFDDLHVKYPHYKAKMWGIGPTGEINARVKDNSVLMALRIDMDNNQCSIVLEEVKVTLGKMKVKVTGLSPFNWLLSNIFTWLTKECQTDIVKTIGQVLGSLLKFVFANTVLDC